MDRSEKRNILLEYCSKGQHFHYNVDNFNRPNENYYPLGWCSFSEADAFTRIVYPFIIMENRFDRNVPNEKVVEAWNEYCEMIEKNQININDL